MKQVFILNNQELAPGIFLLEFKRFFSFTAGQVVRITVNKDIPPRVYSIASGSNDPNIRILYDLVPEGLLTNQLKDLKAGDSIFVSEPFGRFTFDGETAWWIATGTGIAPFYSIFRTHKPQNIRLIHGVRYLNEFLFSEEFKGHLGADYIRCCSREKDNFTFPGRVTDYLKSTENIPVNMRYYLCGSAEMVVDVRDLLIIKGVPYDKIMAEIYF